MIVISKYLVPKSYSGITIFPFIILKSGLLREDVGLLNHERIHLRQQLELLIVFFYVWYILEFLIRLLQSKSWQTAYRNISFEREAYVKEKDLNYLKSRPFWTFFKYV